MRLVSGRTGSHSGRSRLEPREYHAWSTDYLLNLMATVIGVGGSGDRRSYLVRCFFILVHWHGALHTVVFCYFDYDKTATTLILQCASCGSYVYFSLHAHLVYLWRLRAGKLKTRGARLDRMTSVSLAVMFCWYAAISVSVYLEVQGSEYPIPKSVYFLGEASFFLTQILNTIIFIEMALRVNVEADRISKLVTMENFSDKDCRDVALTCIRLGNTFDFPINMLHLEYFVSLLVLVPVRAARIGTSEVALWDVLNTPRQLLEFLIVVRSGNRILQNRRRMRKLIKKTAEFFSSVVSEQQTFAREDCGLTFAISTSLSYKSFWDFISISWGFTLMVLQICLDHKK